MKQFKLSLSLQLLSAFFSLLGIVFSLFVQNTFDDGWRSLLFFTLQSNLWMAVILIIFAIAEILKHKTGTSFINQTRYQVKYVLRTSVMLTLLVFGFLLLPFVSPSYTISITSSSLHFIAPLLALADFLIPDGRLTFPPDNQTVPYFFLNYETYGWVEVKNGSIGVVDWVIIMMGLVLGIAFSLQKLIQCAEVAAKKDKGARYGK